MTLFTLKKVIRWFLVINSIVLIVTGLGITEFRTVTLVTFGLLNKNIAFKLHSYTWLPFIFLLVAHIIINRQIKKLSE